MITVIVNSMDGAITPETMDEVSTVLDLKKK